MSNSGVTIELTRSQIDRVVRHSTDGEGVAGLLRGLGDSDTLPARYKELSDSPRLSRSLLLGLLVLASLPTDGSSLAVTDVAARLNMSPSTTHRYMTTLLAVGLLEQDPRTRRYRLPAGI
jgi:DNA-binding MarR family transcriptional regulator